jgi:hypothetical protein
MDKNPKHTLWKNVPTPPEVRRPLPTTFARRLAEETERVEAVVVKTSGESLARELSNY